MNPTPNDSNQISPSKVDPEYSMIELLEKLKKETDKQIRENPPKKMIDPFEDSEMIGTGEAEKKE